MANRFLSNIKINDSYTLPSADGTNGQIISTDGSGNLSFIDNTGDNTRSIVFTVKNISGGNLTKGTVVHASPSATPPSGNVIEVIKADNDVSGSMPAIGVLNETLADDAEGDCVMMGSVSGIDTSAFNVGDELYVDSSPGAFTATKPTGTSNLIQKIGIVIKSHASNGLIEVFGAGRTNDVPNLVDRTINFADDAQLRIGDDSDLRLYRSGTSSWIRNYNGNLYIDNNADDSDIVFRSDDGAGGITTYMYLDGSIVETRFAKDTRHNDSVIAKFGDGNDLNIYHDGSNSYIKDNGTGDLRIWGDNVNIGTASGNKVFFNNSGVAELYYTGGAKKFETTSTGIAVTGDADCSGTVYVGGNNSLFAENNLRFKSAGAAYIDHNTTGQSISFRTSVSSSLDTTPLVLSGANATFAGDVIVPEYILHDGDSDTYLRFLDDRIDIRAGNLSFIDLREDTNNYAYFNVGGNDIDFQFRGTTNNNLIRTDAGNDRVGIGRQPSYALDVGLGTGNTMRVISDDDIAQIMMSDNDTTAYFGVKNSKAYMSFTSGTASAGFYIDSSGNGTFAGDVSIADGDLEFSAATGNHTIYVADYTGDNYFNADRGNIEIKASSSPNSGNNAKSGGRVLITAGNSYNGQTGDIVLSTGANYLNASDNGLIRFNIGGTASSNEKMRIDSSGRVGIGTTTPSAPLHIDGGSTSEVLKIQADASPYIRFRVGSTNTGFLQFPNGSTAYISQQSNNALVFRTNNTDKMTILANGNVGIGTSSPSYQLDVSGSIKASNQGRFANGSAGAPSYSFDTDSDTGMYRTTTNALGFATAGTNALTIGAAQNSTFAGDIRASADSTHDIGTNTVRFANVYADNFHGLAKDLEVTSNDTFSGTYSLLWHDGADVYSSTWMTINGSTDTFNVPNIDTGAIASGTITITSPAVPFIFNESGHTGNGQWWRMPLDGGNLRFDVSVTGNSGFTTYYSPIQLNSDGTVDLRYQLSTKLETVSEGIKINGRLGLNMDPSTSYQFATQYNQANANDDFRFAHFIDANFSGADNTTADREQGGIYLDIDSSADGDSTDEHRLYGIYLDQRFTGFSDISYGVYARVESNNNTEKTAAMAGVYGYAVHDSGTAGGVGSMYGTRGLAQVEDDGDVDNSYGVHGQVVITSTRAVNVDATFGGYFEVQTDSPNAISYGTMAAIRSVIDNNEGAVPTFGNQYLLFGSYQGTKGSNAYGLYLELEDKNYLSSKLGIENTDPQAKLHIGGATPVGAEALIARGNADATYAVSIEQDHATGWGMIIDTDSTSAGDPALKITNPNGTLFEFESDGDSYFSGNLGIGTTNPDHKLQVNGSIKIANSNSRLLFGTSGGTDRRALEGNTAGTLLQVGEGYSKTALYGDVGIGTTSPSDKLHVVGDTRIEGHLSLRNNVDGDGSILKDINWHTEAAEGTDDRVGLIRMRTQGGTTSTRGGKMSLYVRSAGSSAFKETRYEQNGDWYFPASVNVPTGNVLANSFRPNSSTTTLSIYGYGGGNVMINGVSGATYYYTSGTSTLAMTHQGGYIILATGLAYGAVNNYTKIIDGTDGAITGTTADFSGNVGIASSASLRFNGISDASHAVGYDSTVDGSFLRGQNGMRFITGTGGGTERMRITSDGILKFPDSVQTRKIQLWGTSNNDYEFYGFGIEANTLIYSVNSNTDAHKFYAGTSSTTRNELMIIKGNGNVGIGTTAPATTLHVDGIITTDARNSRDKIRVWSNGTYTIGMKATTTFGGLNDYAMTFQMSNTAARGFWMGDSSHSNSQGAFAVTTEGKATFAHSLRIGYGESDTTTPGASYALDVSGTIRATSDIIAYSDKRVKENIKTIDKSLEKVDKLRGVEFNKIGEDKKSIGVIAQEIEKVIPEVVSTDENGMKSVAYGNITGILIEAIKELKQEIETLKKQINK